MKVSDFIKIIEKDGWYRIKAKGGHRQYDHPARPRDRSWTDEGGLGPKFGKVYLETSGLGLTPALVGPSQWTDT